MIDVIAGWLPAASGYDADIVILTLDRPEETEDAIRSALAQSGLSHHVIVLDQGSTPENLRRFARLIVGRRDAVLAVSSTNLGVAGGRNCASALGLGAVIIALDNDAIFAEESTAACAVTLLQAESGCAVVAFRILNADGSADDSECWGFPGALRPRAGERFACATFVGAGHAIRRQAWAALGGYDPNLTFTWEEFDFSLRAIERGWKLLYAGDIAVHHKRATAGRVHWGERRWFLYVRNRLYIARKWRTNPFELTLQILAYGARSWKIGLLRQGLMGIQAAFAMRIDVPQGRLTRAARRYLYETDGRWRGGFWQRLQAEVFAVLPFSRPTPAGNSSVTKRP
ncbi:MAG TPA: glycosyltransferase [Acidisoma sp.]|nr:glycosyltransferase [Acidisoma sp.]